MPDAEQLRERIARHEPQRMAMALWCEDDVIERAKHRGIELTRKQAGDILDDIDRKQDCELGITWVTLDCFIDDCIS